MPVASPKPRYAQIAEAIAAQIRTGQLPVNAKLASERELCEQWGASKITIRRSLMELARQGLIVTRHGIGSFIAAPSAPGTAGGVDAGQFLGVVIPSAADYHNARVLGALERASRELGYSLIIKQSGNVPQQETEAIQMLLERKVLGLLILPVTGDFSETLVSAAKLLAGKVPFVLFDRYLPMLKAPSVVVDNRLGGYEVVRHLISLGHKKIAYLRGVSSSAAEDRERGYREALAEAGLPEKIVVVGNLQYDMEFAGARISEFLDQAAGQVTAVFAENDGFARAVYNVCRDRGLRIPEDLAVAGFDDAPYASLLMPGLTTVFQPDSQIAHRAIQMLIRLINGETLEQEQIVLSPELRVRDSTNPAIRRSVSAAPRTQAQLAVSSSYCRSARVRGWQSRWAEGRRCGGGSFAEEEITS